MTENNTMQLADVTTLATAIRGEIGKAIVGQHAIVDHLLIALLSCVMANWLVIRLSNQQIPPHWSI